MRWAPYYRLQKNSEATRHPDCPSHPFSSYWGLLLKSWSDSQRRTFLRIFSEIVWKNEHLHRVAEPAQTRALGLQAAGGEGLQHAADHLQGKKLIFFFFF